jgi:hypothetical protein
LIRLQCSTVEVSSSDSLPSSLASTVSTAASTDSLSNYIWAAVPWSHIDSFCSWLYR